MIASKQIAFGGSKRKPYDAEIEYLESTGTQYIELGLFPDNDFSVDFKVTCSNLPEGYRGIFGRYVGTGGKTCYVAAVNYAVKRFTGGWDGVAFPNFEVDSFENRTDVFHLDKFNATVNDTVWNSHKTTIINEDSLTLRFFSTAGQGYNFKGKGYYLKITKNDEPVIDLIPVRVGDVGYMYDRVSGQLFGNAGTGAFVLGADI